LKKNIASILGLSLALSPAAYFSSEVHAEESTNVQNTNEVVVVNLNNSELKDLEKYRNDVVSTLKDLSDEKTYSENLTDAIDSSEDVVAQKVHDVSSVNSSSDLTLITNAPVETYPIDENSTVTFDNKSVIVNEWGESEERLATEEEESAFDEETDDETMISMIKNFVSPQVHAASTHTKTAHNSYTFSDSIFSGWKPVTMYIEAEFTYNGTKVTARRTNNYFKVTGFAPLTSIHEKKSAVQKPSSKRRIAYQSGVIHLGVSAGGNHLNYQELYGRVNVESNQNGVIKRYKSIK